MKFSPLSWLSLGARRGAPTNKHARPAPSKPPARRPGPQSRGGAAGRAPQLGEPQLSSLAQAWLASLPGRLRPTRAAAAYPRIVNRIALCWSDPELRTKVFSELMVDQRGGRRGFPADVAAELLALRDINVPQPQPAPTSARAWDLRTVATSDRDSRFDEGAIATRF